jgi:hypothetical protein
MKVTPRARRWAIAGGMILIISLASHARSSRGPGLKSVTTPPFPMYPEQLRLRTLVPDGWRQGMVLLGTGGSHTQRHTQDFEVEYKPSDPMPFPWLPESLYRWLLRRDESAIRFIVTPVWAPDGRLPAYLKPTDLEPHLSTGWKQASRVVYRGSSAYVITYSASTKSLFDSTRDRVLQSVKIGP